MYRKSGFQWNTVISLGICNQRAHLMLTTKNSKIEGQIKFNFYETLYIIELWSFKCEIEIKISFFKSRLLTNWSKNTFFLFLSQKTFLTFQLINFSLKWNFLHSNVQINVFLWLRKTCLWHVFPTTINMLKHI